jgi:5-methylcytosine-specific restriction endonuclease McrA
MVFVLDENKNRMLPVHPAVARILLRDKKAAVWRFNPFTIILKAEAEEVKPVTNEVVRLKIDYGSRHTGLAILVDDNVVWMGQLHHKTTVKSDLDARRGYRRRRRSVNLRYRPCRYNKDTNEEGWIPPSLQCRVDNIESWTRKLMSYCPISDISLENCKFDTQLMDNPDIQGVEYQQGTLMGYEIREYLLDKFNRTCCYCGATGVPLQVEHIKPESRGGTGRIDNLCIACPTCNETKDNMTAIEFGHPEIMDMVRKYKSNQDCAIINATRYKVMDVLKATGLPLELGSGALTKMNRIKHKLPKSHNLDACCVGVSTPDELYFKTNAVLHIDATGRGQYQRSNNNNSGFPVGKPKPRKKDFFGYQSGDMVKAVIPKGSRSKHVGIHYGRVLCRDTGSFDIKTKIGRLGGISHKYLRVIQRNDGYGYRIEKFIVLTQTNGDAVSSQG